MFIEVEVIEHLPEGLNKRMSLIIVEPPVLVFIRFNTRQ